MSEPTPDSSEPGRGPGPVPPEHAAPAGQPAPPEVPWTRVHPVSPLVRGWIALVAIAFFWGQNWVDDLVTAGEGPGGFTVDADLLIVLGIGLGILLLIVLGFFLSWYFTKYQITERHVNVNSGVVFRQQRQARIDRVQAIDIAQPLLARIVGLAELKFEVADGGSTAMNLAFVKLDEAKRLRNLILARAAGLKAQNDAGAAPSAPTAPGGAATAGATGGPGIAGPGAPGAGVDGPGTGNALGGVPDSGAVDGRSDAGDGPFHPAVGAAGTFPDGAIAPPAGVAAGGAGTAPGHPGGAPASYDVPRQTGAAVQETAPEADERVVASVPPLRLLGSVVVNPWLWFVVVLIGGGLLLSSLTDGGFSVVFLIPGLIGLVPYLWAQFNTGYNFRAAIGADGLRLSYGLLDTRHQTVPPGRVQAVQVTQGIIWKRFGWHKIVVNVAGYGSDGESRSTVLPVGTREDVFNVLSVILPDAGTDRPVELVEAGIAGSGDAEGFTNTPRRARPIAPIAWRRQGFTATGTAVVIRTGRLVRRLVLVPHERTQGITLSQGPLARRFGVADVELATTDGPVSPRIIQAPVDAARAFFTEQSARAAAARHLRDRDHWLEEPAAAGVPAASSEPGRPVAPAGPAVAEPLDDAHAPTRPAGPGRPADRAGAEQEDERG
ncbi:PH domain-containing protein [Zafaria sp. Z1313]|uniref:PH domain-containing protein n=1 Tax=unclassified Zafaria TaxID=2828765 RepID=UPI002E76D36F|nr:PH domain-containing protein [Zafaria sp. J156]MEE1621399.1 PH domain-containing protein [Zafaria sp. J156]